MRGKLYASPSTNSCTGVSGDVLKVDEEIWWNILNKITNIPTSKAFVDSSSSSGQRHPLEAQWSTVEAKCLTPLSHFKLSLSLRIGCLFPLSRRRETRAKLYWLGQMISQSSGEICQKPHLTWNCIENKPWCPALCEHKLLPFVDEEHLAAWTEGSCQASQQFGQKPWFIDNKEKQSRRLNPICE